MAAKQTPLPPATGRAQLLPRRPLHGGQVQSVRVGADEGALGEGRQDRHRRLLPHRGPPRVDVLRRQPQVHLPMVSCNQDHRFLQSCYR